MQLQNTKLKPLLEKAWPYWFGAIILALLNIMMFSLTKDPWGITTALTFWAGGIVETLGFEPGKWTYFEKNNPGSLLGKFALWGPGTWLNIGLIFGALLSSLLASQFRIRKIKSPKFAFIALFGGFLMGYGARIAPRCNIGAIVSGIPSLSLQGWVFALFVFLGAVIGSKILLKYMLD